MEFVHFPAVIVVFVLNFTVADNIVVFSLGFIIRKL